MIKINENKDKDYPKPCCLCDDDIKHIHDDHNARPVKDGRCCTLCNQEIVIPRRIGMIVLEILP